MKTRDYDIIIVGGGMVGATLANALAQHDWAVAVVEAHETPLWNPHQYDVRVSALTQASVNIFKHIQTWESMRSRRVGPYEHMEVWDARGFGAIRFDAADTGADVLGYIVENNVIQLALAERAKSLPSIDWRVPARGHSLRIDDDYATLILDDGETLRAPLIVGADGGNSWVRAQAGIETRGWGYAQQGVVATVRTENPHASTAWQRFLPDGPLAFLPLDNANLCSIVWSVPSGRSIELTKATDDDFNRALRKDFDAKLGDVHVEGPRAAYPLRLQYATQYSAPRIVLVGDAAHNIHPLAGQGVNLGLLDAATLVQTLFEAREYNDDYGALRILRRYERARKGDNIAVMAIMDGFKRLFGATSTPMIFARNLGLNALQRATPLKNLIVRAAMGTRPDQPPLARNVGL